MSMPGVAQEQIPPGEDAAIQEIVASLKEMVNAIYPPGTRPMRRDARASQRRRPDGHVTNRRRVPL